MLGVVVGLAGAEAGRTAPDPVAARSPFAPGSRPAPPPRAPDHAHVVSLRGQLEAVTPTDLVVDGGVHERWILVAEDLQPRFRHDLYPETQPHLRAIEARLRALGVIRSPTP